MNHVSRRGQCWKCATSQRRRNSVGVRLGLLWRSWLTIKSTRWRSPPSHLDALCSDTSPATPFQACWNVQLP
eukprot:37037-Amphidinium_carterae.1